MLTLVNWNVLTSLSFSLYTLFKVPIWKGYILCDSFMTPRKGLRNYSDCENIGGCQGLGRDGKEELRILGQWKYSVWCYNGEYILMVTIYLSKPAECATSRVNPYVNYDLQVTIMMYQNWLISCNKSTTLVENVENW